MKKIPLITAFLVFIVWFFFTFGLKYVLGTHQSNVPLSDVVTKGPNYGIILAAITLILFAIFGKHLTRVGIKRNGTSRIGIFIFPALLVIISLIGSYYAGVFSNTTFVKWALINTLFVGISEELMFRGVFMSSFTNKFGFWPAVIWTTLIFGGIHVLNGFITGDFGLSAIQALLAASSGLLFLAIRIRTLNIIPAMILHWLWDFTSISSGAIDHSTGNPLIMLSSLALISGPVIFGIIGLVSLLNKNAAKAYVDSQVN